MPAPGDSIIVEYRGHEGMLHARMVLAHVVSTEIITVTPDHDSYPEDLGPASPEVSRVRNRGIENIVPFGLASANIYEFNPFPTAGQLVMLVAEAAEEAVRIRAGRGVAEPAVVVPTLAGPAAPPPDAPAAGGGADGDVGGRLLGDAGLGGAGGLGAAALGGVGLGGPGRLAAAFGLPAAGGGVGAAAPPAVLDALGHAGAEDVVDARFLPVRYKAQGRRRRDFRD